MESPKEMDAWSHEESRSSKVGATVQWNGTIVVIFFCKWAQDLKAEKCSRLKLSGTVRLRVDGANAVNRGGRRWLMNGDRCGGKEENEFSKKGNPTSTRTRSTRQYTNETTETNRIPARVFLGDDGSAESASGPHP